MPSLQELGRRWEEFEQSEEESRAKMSELTQNLNRLEDSLREENQGRKRMGRNVVRQMSLLRKQYRSWKRT